ncbi:Putative membrane-bound redox modulator Alx [Phycisphaerales bacterium]|nr:Putative membrane-bound redox modulator Alx [Phycisphaerales bacterium]
MPTLWITFISLILMLVLADLYGWHRGHTRPTRRGEWITAGLYVLLAFVLGGFIHAGYDHHWLGMGLDADGTTRLEGREAATQFVTLTLWQVALDLDGVFVVSALFSHLATPVAVRHRVLLWGILPGMLVRGAWIAGGLWVLNYAEWTKYLFTGLLLLAALRMLIVRQENFDETQNWILRFLRRFVHISGRFDGHSLVTREGGRLALTPLLVAVVLLATADAWIALDSTPALLAISREPFLLFAASTMALLCLRSVYIALEDLRGWLRCVKIGLACVLAYAALVLTAPAKDAPSTLESLILLAACVGAGSVFALRPGARFSAEVSPLGEEAEQAARLALRRARQAIVLVFGLSLLVIGIIMIPAPGPGLVVIFVALAVLGNEFAWAKELVTKYRARAIHAAEQSAALARKRFSPWVLLPVVAATIGFFVCLHLFARVPRTGAILSAVPVIIGQLVWGYMAFYRKPPSDTDSSSAHSQKGHS